jgi:hypothetical protein
MNFTYFAQLNENNIVTQVIVADQAFVDSIGGTWVETFMDSDKKYAGIGDTHDATLNAFISPKCHDEATLDEATCQWNCSNELHTTIKEIENV